MMSLLSHKCFSLLFKALQYIFYIQEANEIPVIVDDFGAGVMVPSDHTEGTLPLIKYLLKRMPNIIKTGAFFNYSHGNSS